MSENTKEIILAIGTVLFALYAITAISVGWIGANNAANFCNAKSGHYWQTDIFTLGTTGECKQ